MSVRIVLPETKDLPRLVEIERRCFPDFPWTWEEFLRTFHMRGMSGTALEEIPDAPLLSWSKPTIFGYMFCRSMKNEFSICNLAIDPNHQRKGYGTILVDRLKERLRRGTRSKISAYVTERNLKAQLFFRSRGFHWVETKHHCWTTCEDDAYVMEFHKLMTPKNRLFRFGGFANAADV